jgi:hypothetical protein
MYRQTIGSSTKAITRILPISAKHSLDHAFDLIFDGKSLEQSGFANGLLVVREKCI